MPVSNEVRYKGEVTITVKNKGVTFPVCKLNSGTKHLLDTITRALAGYTIQESIPRYIDFIQGSPVMEQCLSCLNQPLNLTGTVYGEAADAVDSNGVLLLNSIITYPDKQPISTLSSPRLVLLDSSRKILAYIEDSTALQRVWEEIVDGSEALIEWRMIFVNEEAK